MFYWSRSLTSFNQRQLRAWLVSALKLPKMVTKLLARSCVRQARYAKNIFRNFARLIETFCGWPQSSCGPPSALLCAHSNCWQAPAIEQCGQLQRGPATKASLTCFLLVLPSRLFGNTNIKILRHVRNNFGWRWKQKTKQNAKMKNIQISIYAPFVCVQCPVCVHYVSTCVCVRVWH